MKRCKKCLIPETFPDIKLNSRKLCNLCLNDDENREFKHDIKKTIYKQKFEKYIDGIKGKQEYDCLLLYSGGKDSTYLLYQLKEKYKLKILAVFVDTGLENNVAKKNIKRGVDFFNVDNLTIIPENDLFKRVYLYLIQNIGESTYSDLVCETCQKIIQSIGLNIASEQKIPFVALGYSPDQESNVFEFPREDLLKSWVPEKINKGPFNEKDLSYFWRPKNSEHIPHFIIPFNAIDYPGEEKIIEELIQIGMGKKQDFNPLNSNCHLTWLLQHLDIKKNKYNPYIENLSKQIRYEKARIIRWYLPIKLGTWMLKNRLIKRKEISYALNHIDISLKDIYNDF